MTFHFTRPEWLWAAIPIALILLLARRRSLVEFPPTRQRLTFATRALVIAATLAALAGLDVAVTADRAEIVALVDESDSVSKDAAEQVAAFLDAARRADPTLDVKTIRFARSIAVDGQSALTPDDKRETDLESALVAARAVVDPANRSQILLFSDGLETKGSVARALNGFDVPVSTVPTPNVDVEEVQLAKIELPNRAAQGAPFKGAAIVMSSVATSGVLTFYKNDVLLERRDVEFRVGENRFEFQATAGQNDKEIKIAAVVDPTRDSDLENNAKSAFAPADGAQRALIVSQRPDNLKNFAAALRAQGLALELRPVEALPSDPLELELFDVVMLADVPADALSLRQMEALVERSNHFGGGLVAIGGANSFGAGGYDSSPLGDALPLAAKFEKEKDKPTLAIALLIDRSGSMEGDKLELAKDAAKGVAELLSSNDFLSVLAFDDAPREIVPMQRLVSTSVALETIGAVAADGSTNIYPALVKAIDDLARVGAKYKHIVLLTDGRSAPGDFDAVMRRAANENVTLSAVGVGDDADRFLLEKLAADGAGRAYFCDDPQSVPQIFARETKLADRSAFDENPFLPIPTANLSQIAPSVDFELAPPLLGVDVARAKPDATVALETENGDPLLAFRRFGLGRVVAFASDVEGRWSAEWLDWQDFGAFWAQVARFAAQRPDAARASLDLSVEDDRAVATLDARDRNDERLNDADVELVAIDDEGNVKKLVAEQRAPGLYEASFDVKRGAKYAIKTTASKRGDVFASIERVFVVDVGRESDVKARDDALLQKIADETNGVFQPDPTKLAQIAADQPGAREKALDVVMLLVALAVYVLDVYLRRGVLLKEKMQ